MSHRLHCSVEQGTGVITMRVVGHELRMQRREASDFLRELAWAINASAEETDVRIQNKRKSELVNRLYNAMAEWDRAD